MKDTYNIGDQVRFKKKHPCGSDVWKIIRIGMDFKAECTGCGKIITMKRRKFEKSVKEKIKKN
mgnify:CR=1 FL=1